MAISDFVCISCGAFSTIFCVEQSDNWPLQKICLLRQVYHSEVNMTKYLEFIAVRLQKAKF